MIRLETNLSWCSQLWVGVHAVRFTLGYEMLELFYLSLVHVSRNCRNGVMKKKAPGNLWLESWLAVG